MNTTLKLNEAMAMTTASLELNEKALEYMEAAAEADKAGERGMAFIYLRKARNYFADAGEDALVAQCEEWMAGPWGGA